MKITVIDNYDSFTYNLVQYLGQLGAEVLTIRNDCCSISEILSPAFKMAPDRILLSPGPGRPDDAGVSLDLINQVSKMVDPIPILGVCLGHQTIGQVFGGVVSSAKRIMHGKVSEITHNGKGLFEGIPSPYTVTRYHSLALVDANLPKKITVNARTNDREIMAIEIENYPFYGVQFHPEAILTKYGHDILKNFLEIK
jgi:anthranilate synthase/aminodeoxychorismate synthase-like glutamine amidotransferase